MPTNTWRHELIIQRPRLHITIRRFANRAACQGCLRFDPITKRGYLGAGVGSRAGAGAEDEPEGHGRVDAQLGQGLYQVAALQIFSHQRCAGQHHALACEGGLGHVGGVAKIQPALGRQLGQALRVEPAPPRQPLEVGGVRVTRFYEGEVGKVGGAFDFGLRLEQPRACQRGELLAKHANSMAGHLGRRPVAQGDVGVSGFHVD
jgi:hypothetical protein